MKKHFLLLVMAFMSISAWAAITVGEPTKATGLKYNGSAQALITADGAITGATEGNEVTVLYRIADTKPTFTVAAHEKWVTKASLTATDAGTYKVWYVAFDEDDQVLSTYEDDQFVEVTIAQKSLTGAGSGITFTKPGDVTYTGVAQTFTPNVTDGGVAVAAANFTVAYTYSIDGTAAYADAASVTAAGYYKQVITGAADGNYSGSLTSDAFQVKPADLLVSVKEKNVMYTGAALAYGADDIVYDGFVGGEDADDLDTKPTVTNANVNAGTYNVIAAGGVSNNYNFVYVKGKLTINARKFKVYVLPQTAVIGSDEAAITSWTGSEYFSNEAVGKYANERIKLLIQNGLNAAGEATYPNPETPANFETNNDNILGYFATTEYTVGEGIAAVDYEYITGLTLTRPAGTSANEYALTASGATAAANYAIAEYVQSTFTIGKANVTITLDNQAKVYGETDPEFTYTIEGADEADVEAIKAKITVTREEGEDAGSYNLTLTVADYDSFANYNVPEHATNTAKLIITKRPLTITANDQVLYVGNSFEDLDQTAVTFNGLKSGETINVELSFSAEVLGDLDTDDKLAIGVANTKTYDDGIEVSIAAGQEAITKNYSYAATDLVAGDLTVIKSATVLFLDDTDENLATTIQTAATDAVSAKRIVKFSTRTLKAGQWNTLVLPFATTVAKISEALGYAVVDVLAPSTSTESISLKLAFGDIAANTPFMVQPSADIDLKNITFDGGDGTGETIVYSADPKVGDGQGHFFKGTYTGYNVTSADKSEYYYSSSQKKFVNSSTSTKIGIMRAYLKDTNAAGAGARIITIEEPDGSVTAIDAVETENGNGNGNGAIYNLQGVRVNKAGKGVFIQNGKKYIK